MDFSQENLLSLVCAIPALVIGLTVHEFAHAWTGWKLGDDTPRREGRITLDPAKHIDPMGALIFVITSLFGMGFGWAKPVNIQPRNMRHPRRDSLLVAIAGPISNLLQTPFWLAGLWIFGFLATKMNWALTPNSFSDLFSEVLVRGVIINIGLAAFNMIPIPPLDGHWVLQAVGGRPVEEFFDQIRPFSFFILIIIINIPGFLSSVLGPVYFFALKLATQVLTSGAMTGAGM